MLESFPDPPSFEGLVRFVEQDIWQRRPDFWTQVRPLQLLGIVELQPQFASHPSIVLREPIPAFATSRNLADWLGVSLGQLDWFADCHGQERNRSYEALRHYSYQWIPRKVGSSRLLESPKRRLREIQRSILTSILNYVPTHENAHGFCRGRSIRTFVEPHCGQNVLLRTDLQNFFATVSASRIRGIFRTIGYPTTVSKLLTGLCTNSVPDSVLQNEVEKKPANTIRLFRSPHLPQGSPTSPALANLIAFRLDCRLSGLAKTWDVNYTRYADDLAFSGDRSFARRMHAFRVAVLAILLDEGFAIRHRKTHVATASDRQLLAGVLVNQHPNVVREDYDRLRAILHNCRRFGPESQNRDDHPDFRAHLQGRIGFVTMIHQKRGHKLQLMFDAIDWT